MAERDCEENLVQPLLDSVDVNDALEEPALIHTSPKKSWWSRRTSQQKIFVGICVVCSIVVGLVGITRSVAQNAIEETDVQFESIKITNPQDDLSGFTVSSNATIDNPFVTANMHSMSVDVSADGSIGSFRMPSKEISGGTVTTIEVEEFFYIHDYAAFVEFTQDLIHEPVVSWHLSSKAHVSPVVAGLSLPAVRNLDFAADVDIAGCDGLQDVKILELDFSSSTPEEVRVEVLTSIHNPSTVAMDPIGDLTMDIVYDGVFVGRMVAYNAKVNQGQNILRMEGTIDPAEEDLDTVSMLMSNYLNQIDTPVQAVAPTVGASSIPLYSDALAGLTLHVDFPGSPELVVTDVEFHALTLGAVDNDYADMWMDMTIHVYNPLGDNAPVEVSNVSLAASFWFDSKEVGYVEVSDVALEDPVVGFGKNWVRGSSGGRMEIYDGFVDYIVSFTLNEVVPLTLTGLMDSNMECSIGMLTLRDLTLDVDSELAGFNGLEEVSILWFDLPYDSPLGGVALYLNMSLMNPSIGSVYFEHLTFDVLYEGAYMGTVRAEGVDLIPGENILSCWGNLNPAEEDLDLAGQFFSQYLTGVDSPVRAVGVDAGPDNEVEWMQAAVQALDIHTIFEGIQDFDMIDSLAIETLAIAFREDGTPLVSANLTAGYVLPFDFPVNITAIAMEAAFVYEGHRAGSMSIGYTDATLVGHNTITMELVDIPVSVPEEEEDAFVDMLYAFMDSPSVTVGLEGICDGKADVSFGNIEIVGLAVKDNVTLAGLNAFRDVPPSVLDLDIRAGPEINRLELDIAMELYNPADIVGNLGRLSFSMFFRGVYLAHCWHEPFIIQRGSNVFEDVPVTYYTPDDQPEVGMEFFSNYMNGVDQLVVLRGTENASPYPLLARAMSRVEIQLPFPGRAKLFISQCKLDVNLISDMADEAVDARMKLDNDYGVEVWIEQADFDIFHEFHETRVAFFQDDGTRGLGLPLYVPAYSHEFSEKVRVQLVGVADIMDSILELLRPRGGYLDIEGYLWARFGEAFETGLYVVQKDIPTNAYST